MKLYMGYDHSIGGAEGACLIVANTVKEGKVIGFDTVQDWFDTEWIDFRVCLIKENIDYLIENEVDKDKWKAGTPHVIDDPKVCPYCELWGGGEVVDEHCNYCRED